MNIHQFNMQFSPEEDRILFRMNTVSKEEFRFYFTRRFVKLLWSLLIQLLENDYKLREPEKTHVIKDLMAFEHDHIVSEANFNQQYSGEHSEQFPLGKAYVLLTGIKVRQGESGNILCFFSSKGKGIEFQVNNTFIHMFCELLKKVVQKADWNIEGITSEDSQVQFPRSAARVLH